MPVSKYCEIPCSILKETIVWIEHLVGQEKEPLSAIINILSINTEIAPTYVPGYSSIIQALFSLKLDPESGFQVGLVFAGHDGTV